MNKILRDFYSPTGELLRTEEIDISDQIEEIIPKDPLALLLDALVK